MLRLEKGDQQAMRRSGRGERAEWVDSPDAKAPLTPTTELPGRRVSAELRKRTSDACSLFSDHGGKVFLAHALIEVHQRLVRGLDRDDDRGDQRGQEGRDQAGGHGGR